MTRKKAWCLGFFGALIFYWSAATLWSRFDWSREWKLTFSSADAEAVVTRIEPNNHCIPTSNLKSPGSDIETPDLNAVFVSEISFAFITYLRSRRSRPWRSHVTT